MDVWVSADEAYYVQGEASGDWVLTARVDQLDAQDPWAKAGLMLRDSLDANAANISILLSNSNGVFRQIRTAAGNGTTSVAGSSASAPHWLRLEKSGSTVSAYESANGSDWTLVSSDPWGGGDPALVGLFLTAHDASLSAGATFSAVEWSGASSSGGGSVEVPTDLQAGSVTGASALLNWETEGNPQNIRIERAEGGGAFEPVALLDGRFREYRDPTLDPGRSYRYRVVSISDGQQSSPSAELAVESGALEFAEWQLRERPLGSQAGANLGWAEDYTGDGLINAFAWAMGFAPDARMTGGSKQVTMDGDTIGLRYREAWPQAINGVMVPQFSEDLIGWDSLPSLGWTYSVIESGEGWRKIEWSAPAGFEAASGFFRLQL